MRYPTAVHTISCPFGERGTGWHNGTDFKTPTKTKEVAVADAKVIFSGIKKVYGECIILQHQGFCTLSAHLYKRYVKQGQFVAEGDLIALTGNSGYSTGPHLHFEYRVGTYSYPSFWDKSNGIKFDNSRDVMNYIMAESGQDKLHRKYGADAIGYLNANGVKIELGKWKTKMNEPPKVWFMLVMLARTLGAVIKLINKK